MEVSTPRRGTVVEQPLGQFLTAPSSHRSRAEVMAVVRDEMRAPLLGLEALLDALAGATHSQELSERMQGHSRVLARRVSLLIEDLALVATHDQSTIPMEPQPLDLDAELTACADAFPDVLIRVVGEPGMWVHADALRVQQIFANLVRSSQRKGAHPMTIRVTGKPELVSLHVSSAGPSDSHELGIVTRLVRAHGGMTTHETTGSFIFTLPRAVAVTRTPVLS